MTEPWDRSENSGRRLDGRVALVTGAGTDDGVIGIGAATAVLFATQGAKVGVVDISPERADVTRRKIADDGGECVVAIGDLTNPDDNARCTTEIAAAFGRLDILVNISSIAGTHGFGGGAYAASKAALIGLTKDWAYLHGRDGIRVNCLVLGHVYAPMGMSGGESQRDPRRRAGLLGTEATVWDVAWPAVFLASEESRWITGVVLPVDAGTTAATSLGMDTLNERSSG